MATQKMGTFVSGTDFTFTFTLNTDGAATDLSSAISVNCRIKFKAQEKLAAKALVDNDAANGIMDLVLTDTETADWFAGTYEGDVKAVLDSGAVRNLGLFTFIIRRAVTP